MSDLLAPARAMAARNWLPRADRATNVRRHAAESEPIRLAWRPDT
jgi:hypothetical protein